MITNHIVSLYISFFSNWFRFFPFPYPFHGRGCSLTLNLRKRRNFISSINKGQYQRFTYFRQHYRSLIMLRKTNGSDVATPENPLHASDIYTWGGDVGSRVRQRNRFYETEILSIYACAHTFSHRQGYLSRHWATARFSTRWKHWCLNHLPFRTELVQ